MPSCVRVDTANLESGCRQLAVQNQNFYLAAAADDDTETQQHLHAFTRSEQSDRPFGCCIVNVSAGRTLGGSAAAQRRRLKLIEVARKKLAASFTSERDFIAYRDSGDVACQANVKLNGKLAFILVFTNQPRLSGEE